MKTAFAYREERIAPVFDIARRIRVVEAEAGRIISEAEEVLPDDPPVRKALRLADLGVGLLVCGAISRPLGAMVAAYGIELVPFVAGDLREVIQAWLSGHLVEETFAMPGCRGRGRSRRGRGWITNQEDAAMNGGGRGRGGRGGGGGGGGQGRGGQGRGRMGGPLAAGAVGTCRCPKCGHREPHERGVPCVERPCPQCGTAMVRE
ncbi:MAG: NifB/NifX family molybdenum-iron cluster-binding protein [Planctomycetes bacterium]|nr:NifB/NifX family molybdenum-iron cluster-binding protein [Planctomycetota bacterium]